MEYDVSDFMKQCVQSYITLAGGPEKVRLRKAKTPFTIVDDPKTNKPIGNYLSPDELEAKPGEDVGQLASVAASVLTKILYGARMARWDLLKAVGILATRLNKWTSGCDKALHRLVGYIDETSDLSFGLDRRFA